MAIRGSLGEASLADVLQLLVLGGKTGCLSVFEGNQFGRIYLDEGRICHASIVNRKDRLGDLLLKNRVIDPEVLSRAIEAQKGQHPPRLGEILLAGGSIEKASLEHYIVIQIEEAVYFLSTWTHGQFHFDPDKRPDERELLVSIDAEELLLEGARRVDEWALITKKVPGLQSVFARVDRGTDSSASLSEEQRRILPFLDGERSLREVVEESGLLEFEAMRALFGLVQAGYASPRGRKEEEGEAEQSARIQEHVNLGAAFYQTGMLEESERELLRVLEMDPANWGSDFKIASIEIRTGRMREAARRLMRLISDGRYAPSVFQNLALSLEALGRADHALLTTAEGLRHFQDHPGLLLSRAVLLTKLSRPRAALRYFDGYRDLSSRAETPPVHFFIFSVLALASAGRRTDASSRAAEGLESYPRSAPLLLHAGLIHERDGRLADAAEMYQRAVTEDPELRPAQRAHADALFALGRLIEAGESYRALLDSGAESTEVLFRLGAVAYKRGHRIDAVRYWRDTLRKDPSHARARTRLELIGAGTYVVDEWQ